MKRTRAFLVGIFLLVAVMLAGPSRAAVFSCDDGTLTFAFQSTEWR